MQITHNTFTKDGVTHSTKKLYARFYDHNKVRRNLPLFVDRESTNEAARSIQRLVNHRASGCDIPIELQRFIENTLPSIRDKLVEWSIIDAARVASVTLLTEHLSSWETYLLSKNNGVPYVNLKLSRVRRLFAACKFKMWSDIRATTISVKLAEWRRTEDMSAQTSNFYLQAAKQFCHHMVKVEKRALASPLEELSYQNVKTDRRHDRRAYSVEEFRYLLGHLSVAETIWEIPAAERALIYQFAAETGLRFGAIRKVEIGSFGWDKGSPAVKVLAGAPNKYKEERWFPFTHALWILIEKNIAGKSRTDKAFKMPPGQRAAKLIRKDLDAARARWINEAVDEADRERRGDSQFLRYEDDRGRFLDFHAFRHTRGVWLFQHHHATGRDVQDLSGVSSLAMVARYTQSLETDHAVIHRGPDLTPTPPAPVKQAESLAPSLAQTGGLSCTPADSGELEGGLKATG